MQINDYGKLCTMMYEQLHPTADPQELAFYLSYAKPGEQMLELLCGSRALHYLALNWAQNTAVGRSLSVKPGKTAQAVERLQGELQAVKARCADLEESSFQRLGEDYRDAGNVLLVQPPMESDSVRRLCDAVSRSCGGRCAVFAGGDGSYKYAVIHPGQDISPLIKALNAQLHGRGGGSAAMIQGSAQTDETTIREYINGI